LELAAVMPPEESFIGITQLILDPEAELPG
jgi:hypothetical protein